jgi:hypothetical protein
MARAGGAGLVVRSSDDDHAHRHAPVGHGHLLRGATRKRARKSNHGVAPRHDTAATITPATITPAEVLSSAQERLSPMQY